MFLFFQLSTFLCLSPAISVILPLLGIFVSFALSDCISPQTTKERLNIRDSARDFDLLGESVLGEMRGWCVGVMDCVRDFDLLGQSVS